MKIVPSASIEEHVIGFGVGASWGAGHPRHRGYFEVSCFVLWFRLALEVRW